METTTSSPNTVASPQPQRRRNRWILWTGRILLGLLALIVLLAASGATYEAIMASGDAKRYPPPGQLVDVGGHRLHLYCVGQGSPTVVLDAGLGAFSLDWGAVQPQIATSTRVCAYDRAGLGWSEPGPLPRSPQQFADELQLLLTKAGVEGPYVLVAHSISGKTARLFASQHPNDVAGMVLIDARHESVDEHSTPEQIAAEDAPAAALPGHDQVDGEVWAGAAAVGADVAKGAARERESFCGDTDRHRRPAGAPPADRDRSRGGRKGAWKATLCFIRRRPLATRHSSSWRRRRASITCHSGRKRNRSWLGCRRTAAWSSPRAATLFISSSPHWWWRAFARSSMPHVQVSRCGRSYAISHEVKGDP